MDTVTALLKVLDPADNSTGGGTASALAGAMAASLAAMVARVSKGKGLGEPDTFYEQLSAAGEQMADELAAGAGRDAEAFDGVKAAYRLPKESTEQKAARSEAIQEALEHAALVPLDNAGLCSRVLEITAMLEGRSNANALSDLQCAGYLAQAGLSGCLANVAINLTSIKDREIVAAIRERIAALGAQAGPGGTTEDA